MKEIQDMTRQETIDEMYIVSEKLNALLAKDGVPPDEYDPLLYRLKDLYTQLEKIGEVS